ncbi:hypothetical protein EIP86_008353 [Pleurotus ostreatoroseus]|nr:hypothetical protein EIP86_008353 [Pleurotus ostreatoroseus]
MPRFKLTFFVPVKDTQTVLNHVFAKFPNNVGKIGEYESCAFVSPGTGQFKPGPKANPTIGHPGQVEFVEENKVEVVVTDVASNAITKAVIKELKSVHPYEEVAYDVYRLEDF